MSKRHLITAAIAATAAAITLSACSSSASPTADPSMSGPASMSGSPSMSSMSSLAGGPATAQAGAPAAGPHNTADVTFATDMIPHHAQALEMAKLALSKASSPQVKQLAQMIENEQTPEITAMAGWLQGWNKPVPSTTSMGGMNRGDAGMPGMMSVADMSELSSASGATFDRLFLDQMITHHTGALAMANTELSQGENTDAKSLARSIIAGQSKEITVMKTLLPAVK